MELMVVMVMSKNDACLRTDKNTEYYKAMSTKICDGCFYRKLGDCEHINSWSCDANIKLYVHQHLTIQKSKYHRSYDNKVIVKDMSIQDLDSLKKQNQKYLKTRYNASTDTFDVIFRKKIESLNFNCQSLNVPKRKSVIDEFAFAGVQRITKIYEINALPEMKKVISGANYTIDAIRAELEMMIDHNESLDLTLKKITNIQDSNDTFNNENERHDQGIIELYKSFLSESKQVKLFSELEHSFIGYAHKQKITADIDNLLVLDASTSSETYQELYDINFDKVISSAVEYSDDVEVNQIFHHLYSKNELLDGEQKNMDLSNDIKEIFNRHQGAKTALISNKELLDKIQKDAGVTFDTTGYFYHSTGTNIIENEQTEVLVIVGRPQIPEYELELMSMCHGVYDMSYHYENSDIEMRAKTEKVTTRVKVYDSKIVQALYELTSINQLYQAINRLRFLYQSDYKKYCYIFTTVDHGVQIDNALFRDVDSSIESKIEIYLNDNNCLGVLPMDISTAINEDKKKVKNWLESNRDTFSIKTVRVKQKNRTKGTKDFFVINDYSITENDLPSGWKLL